MREKEGHTSDKLSNQFQQLNAVAACKRYLLIYKYSYSTAAICFPLYYSNKPRARCSFWQGAEVQVFTAIENN